MSEAQCRAIRLTKTAIDCFNSKDGIGLFSGMARYNVLEDRIRLCAVQARNLPQFWSILLTKMLWPTPPKRMDEIILSQLDVMEAGMTEADELLVLRSIATETPFVVMLARYWHDQTKKERREMEEEWRQIEDGVQNARTEEQEGLGV